MTWLLLETLKGKRTDIGKGIKEFKEMRFCKNQRPGLQERVEKTEKLWFVHKGVYFESLVCAEVPTSALMDSVRSKGIRYTRLRQTNVDQECNRQSK